MDKPFLEEFEFLRKIFDAVPLILLVVDFDFNVYHLNSTASLVFGSEVENSLGKKGGELLHCINSDDVYEGCGWSRFCKDCVIRNSINQAVTGGRIFQKKTKLEISKEGEIKEIDFLVTSSTFEFEDSSYVLLILENISELLHLRGILPICPSCKKIRNNKEYWEDVEQYFSNYFDVEFTEGLCPECILRFLT